MPAERAGARAGHRASMGRRTMANASLDGRPKGKTGEQTNSELTVIDWEMRGRLGRGCWAVVVRAMSKLPIRARGAAAERSLSPEFDTVCHRPSRPPSSGRGAPPGIPSSLSATCDSCFSARAIDV